MNFTVSFQYDDEENEEVSIAHHSFSVCCLFIYVTVPGVVDLFHTKSC